MLFLYFSSITSTSIENIKSSALVKKLINGYRNRQIYKYNYVKKITHFSTNLVVFLGIVSLETEVGKGKFSRAKFLCIGVVRKVKFVSILQIRNKMEEIDVDQRVRGYQREYLDFLDDEV